MDLIEVTISQEGKMDNQDWRRLQMTTEYKFSKIEKHEKR